MTARAEIHDEPTIVVCPCGCGAPADQHHHPFGISEAHREFCRRLAALHLLKASHEACGR